MEITLELVKGYFKSIIWKHPEQLLSVVLRDQALMDVQLCDSNIIIYYYLCPAHKTFCL